MLCLNGWNQTKPNGAIYHYTYDVMNRLTEVDFQANSTDDVVPLKSYQYETLSNHNTQKTEIDHVNDTENATKVSIYDYKHPRPPKKLTKPDKASA